MPTSPPPEAQITPARSAFPHDSDGRRTDRVLFVSNGHGEDAIACKVIDRVRRLAHRRAVELRAWPMVGRGDAYVRWSVPIVGVPNHLPSEGFATLDARLFARDLRAGWLATHWRQVQAARALRGRYALIVAVGDVVPIAAARLARTPCVFIGCAKSAYYGPGYGYTALERRWGLPATDVLKHPVAMDVVAHDIAQLCLVTVLSVAPREIILGGATASAILDGVRRHLKQLLGPYPGYPELADAEFVKRAQMPDRDANVCGAMELAGMMARKVFEPKVVSSR